MPVYVDTAEWPFRGQLYCHVMADELDQLHAMADKIGLKRSWFQNKRGSTPHYDLAPSKRALAVANGAVEIDRKATGQLIKYWRDKTR